MLAQCIYGWSDEGGEYEDGKERSEIPGGWERVEIEGYSDEMRLLLYADDVALTVDSNKPQGLVCLASCVIE